MPKKPCMRYKKSKTPYVMLPKTKEIKKSEPSLHCEICGKKVNSLDDLTDYDGLLVDTGYQTCDKCTETLETHIKELVNKIRDYQWANE